jgi:hypothetical protein
MLSEREGDHGAEAAAGVCRMKGTWSFRVIPINQIANFYRHEHPMLIKACRRQLQNVFPERHGNDAKSIS